MRVVLRIGGSIVASPIRPDLIGKYANIAVKVRRKNHELGVVVGGGALAREFIAVAKDLGLDQRAQDDLAISVSRLHAQLLIEKLGEHGCSNVQRTIQEAIDCIQKGRIAVMGGLKPGITTDAVAALLTERLGADLYIKATDREGVFDKDPRKYPDAEKLDHLSWNELTAILTESRHEAGMHQILDPEAVRILSKRKVKVIVVNGVRTANVLRAVEGERVGTLID